jgi:O-antigen/teichoic acid export membrane protein
LIVLLVIPRLVITTLYGESFAEAALALQIMSLGSIAFVLSGSNGMTLTMTGRHRDLLVCSLASLAVYIVISPPLTTRWGVAGAATAFTLQTILQNVIVTVRVKQTVGIWTLPFASLAMARSELTQLLRRLRRS